MNATDYALAGRLKKAYELARVLHREGVTVERLQQYTPNDWTFLVAHAGYTNTELSAETKALTIQKLAMLYDPEAK